MYIVLRMHRFFFLLFFVVVVFRYSIFHFENVIEYVKLDINRATIESANIIFLYIELKSVNHFISKTELVLKKWLCICVPTDETYSVYLL